MKGYEAARRNMALMYMRSERSDLNLRMTQVGDKGVARSVEELDALHNTKLP